MADYFIPSGENEICQRHPLEAKAPTFKSISMVKQENLNFSDKRIEGWLIVGAPSEQGRELSKT